MCAHYGCALSNPRRQPDRKVSMRAFAHALLASLLALALPAASLAQGFEFPGFV